VQFVTRLSETYVVAIRTLILLWSTDARMFVIPPHAEWLNAKGKRLGVEEKQQGALGKSIQQELEWINKK
jgi:hypothetical protein